MNGRREPVLDNLLTVQDLVKLAHLSRATIFRLIAAGKGPKPVRLSARGLRFRPRDAEAWVRDRTGS